MAEENPTSALKNPIEASVGAAFGGTVGALSGSTWLASELAKFGRYLAGTPGEVSAAALGAGTGAVLGAAVGGTLGALSGRRMVNYVLSDRGPIAVESALESPGIVGAIQAAAVSATDSVSLPLRLLGLAPRRQ